MQHGGVRVVSLCLHRCLSIFAGSGVVMATRESFLHDGRCPLHNASPRVGGREAKEACCLGFMQGRPP